MAQDSVTSSGGKETGIALPGGYEIEPVIPGEIEDIGLSGPGPTSNFVLTRGFSKPGQARPKAGPSFRHQSLIGAPGPGCYIIPVRELGRWFRGVLGCLDAWGGARLPGSG